MAKEVLRGRRSLGEASREIDTVHGREILDSRGRPTVEAELGLANGTIARASVPSGASTGRHEAVELRDGDPARYRGRGVLRAVANVNGEIAAALHGQDARPGERSTRRSSSSTGRRTSRASAPTRSWPCRWRAPAPGPRALACRSGVISAAEPASLPLPMVNIISGGLHAGRKLDFQDFLVVPVGAATYREALRDRLRRVRARRPTSCASAA